MLVWFRLGLASLLLTEDGNVRLLLVYFLLMPFFRQYSNNWTIIPQIRGFPSFFLFFFVFFIRLRIKLKGLCHINQLLSLFFQGIAVLWGFFFFFFCILLCFCSNFILKSKVTSRKLLFVVSISLSVYCTKY